MSSKKMAVVEHLRKAFDNGKVTSRDEIREKIDKLDKAGLQELSSHLKIKFLKKDTKPKLARRIEEKVKLLQEIEEVNEDENTWKPIEVDP